MLIEAWQASISMLITWSRYWLQRGPQLRNMSPMAMITSSFESRDTYGFWKESIRCFMSKGILSPRSGP